MLKHYWIYSGDVGRSRVAVKDDGERVVVKCLTTAPHVRALANLLVFHLGEEGLGRALALHRERQHRFATHVRVGMSGCRDLFLVEERDPEFGAYPRHHLVHVSMYGKLNEGLSVWLGDIPVLLDWLNSNYPSDEQPIEEAEIYSYHFVSAHPEDDYEDDYFSSETLERLRAIQFSEECEDESE